MPAGLLPQPRRRVALARRERDGLGDEGGEREALEQRVAERAARGDRVERAGAVDDRVRELDAAEVDHALHDALELGRVEHRAVDAQAHVAARGWGRRSRSRRRSRRPCPDSSASWAGTLALGAQRAHRLEHRRRAAGVDLGARVAAELGGQQVGDEAVVAGRAVVGRDAGAGDQRGALGVRRVAEAEQHERRGPERVAPDRQRRDPDAAADEDRPAPVARRARSRAPSGPSSHSPSPSPQLAEPARCRGRRPRAGSRACRRRGARRTRERARQERALVRRRRPSARPRRACRTGPGRAPARPGRRSVERRRRRRTRADAVISASAGGRAARACGALTARLVHCGGPVAGPRAAPAARPPAGAPRRGRRRSRASPPSRRRSS